MRHLARQALRQTKWPTRCIKQGIRCIGTAAETLPCRDTSHFITDCSYKLPSIPITPIPYVKPADRMPPCHKASVGRLETFVLPEKIEDNAHCRSMASAMIQAWQKTSIFQIQMTSAQRDSFKNSIQASKAFFKLPFAAKAKYVDGHSFAGYIASGEELTGGIADYSEIFTVTKDLPLSDSRVQAGWPCHGPCPWPSQSYGHQMSQFMDLLGESGDKLLKLTAIGLGLKNMDSLLELTKDGWHHMRNLRFPSLGNNNGTTKKGRGIGSHTDYGLLVIAAPDTTGGDFVRPRLHGESITEWQTSAARACEDDDDEKWLFVPPIENTMTVFPGDMMQLLTNGHLSATPHKVALNTSERYAFAYFHEPNFNSVIETLPEFRERVHYGSHFTKQFMKNYPQRITAKQIHEENRLEVLAKVREDAFSIS